MSSSLRQTHSDLLFSVQSGGRKVLLYLLFEHQTTVDPAMPLRLLGYLLEIWRDHEKQRGLPLPAVLPFVLHQGPDSWTVSTHFEALLDMPEGLAELLSPYQPKFSHALLDLASFDPAQDGDHAQLRVILQLMKLARQKRMLEFFEWLAKQMVEPLPGEFLRLSLTYALHADSHLDVERIYHTLESNPRLRDQTMSIAQQLIAQGKAEGKAEGKVEGKMEGKLQLLQELMELPVTSAEELALLSFEELQVRFQAVQREYDARFKNR